MSLVVQSAALLARNGLYLLRGRWDLPASNVLLV